MFLPEEEVIYLFPNEGSETEKFSINTVQYGFQEVPLSEIRTIINIWQQQQQFSPRKTNISTIISVYCAFI